MEIGALVLGGRFRVLHAIGGGGMSQVYLAEQVSLQRRVALKVLRPDVSHRHGMSERFRREAQLLSSVDHPGVVRIIDFDDSDGRNVLVLELAEGETLEHSLEKQPMDVGRAVKLLAQLAAGLTAIHAKGIIHRDLKPANVVLTPTPRGEMARLLDFGIAKLLEVDDELSGVSQPGQVVGTPAYVAPEQARGGVLDLRTDVYSFGVLAYRMLTGELPFAGPSPREFMVQHLTETPKPLNEISPHLIAFPELTGLVLRCLEKDPEKRPSNGEVLFSDICNVLPVSPAALFSDPFGTGIITAPSGQHAQMNLGAAGAGPAAVPLGAAGPLATPRTAVPPQPPQASQPSTVVDGPLAEERAGKTLASRVSKAVHAVIHMDKALAQSLGVVLILLMVAAFVWKVTPRSPSVRAATLLERGRADEVLPLIDGALLTETSDVPLLYSMKAAALHQLARHDDERVVIREHLTQALHAAYPLMLEGLCEDFARDETDGELRSFLDEVPRDVLTSVLVPLAKRAPSPRQWGALRYLDVSGTSRTIDRVKLYGASLLSVDCNVRVVAAKRLTELQDPDAIPLLRRLSEMPKEDWGGGPSCGQDEAAEAIRALNRHSAR